MKHTVWGYGRVSPGRKGTSIDRQWDIFNAWWNSETRKFTYPDEKYTCNTKENWFFDAYVSGVETECHERDGIRQILKQMKKGDVFIVSLLDRLGRNSRDLLTFISALRESGIRFAALDLNMDTETPEGYFAITIFAAMAQFETDRKRERVEAGVKKLEKAGCWVKGNPPFGWKTYNTTSDLLGGRKVKMLKRDEDARLLGDTILFLRDRKGHSFNHISEIIKTEYMELIPRDYIKRGLSRTDSVINLKKTSLMNGNVIKRWYAQIKAGYPQKHVTKPRKRKKKSQLTSFTTKLIQEAPHVPLSPALSVPLAFSDS